MRNPNLSTVLLSTTLLVVTMSAAAEPPAEKLEFAKWSDRVNVPDPVAISLDNHGRVYVTQTQRRKSQDLDIRANRDWIPFDVGFRTVDEKRDFYHQRLAPEHSEKSKKRVDDMNGDGSHDWRDLTVLSEKIHRVEDTDGDGKADKITLFAEDFRTEVTGIAAGVLWYDNPDAPHGDVYTTIAPDVWRLRDTNGDGKADQRDVVATGFGLHVAYAGHDMHGLTVGTDGRLYWTVGDKGISVVDKEGRRHSFPNQGGVLRCDPDGSNFEVFAHGLRNVQELAFDEYGNLFGVDNDADQPGERERVVHILPQSDSGWRCNYQYRGDDFNPWTDEGLWKTRFDGQPAYVTPPIAHSLDGPAGFAFNPGTALAPAYRDYFFLTGAPGGKQIAFQLKPNGASFEVANEHEIGKGLPLVGINFGPDGGLYAVDWGGGYPLNQKGAIWKIDAPEHADSPARREVAELLATGVRDREPPELVRLLNHADQRIRLAAQFELVRRKGAAGLIDVAKRGPQLARVHAIWGLGQLLRAGKIDGAELVRLLGDADPEIRTQSARVAADVPEFDGRLLVPLLADESPRVQLFAALALGRHPTPAAIPSIVELLDQNDGKDLALRHAGIVALAACGGASELVNHESEAVRLAAVVALRRNSDGNVATFLNDESELVVAEAARAIHDDTSIDAALGALAQLLDAGGVSGSEVVARRSINAAFRLGRDDDALRVARFAADETVPLALRLDALGGLREWLEPPLLDRVNGRSRLPGYGERSLPLNRLSPLLSSPLRSEDARVRTAALATARTIGVRIEDDVLVELVASEKRQDALRVEALAVLAAQESSQLDEAITRARDAKSATVRIAGLEQLAKRDSDAASRAASETFENSQNLRERQAAVTLLGSLPTGDSVRTLARALESLRAGRLDAAVALDVREAAEQLAERPIGKALAAGVTEIALARNIAAQSDPIALFTECLDGGDPAAGRRTFVTNVSANCIRCHRIGKEGSDVGPALDDVGTKRKPDFILRSIVAPSADIDEKYRMHVVLLDSGKTLQGIVKKQTDDELVLVDAKGKEHRIPTEEIEESIEQKVSIMPQLEKQITKREIRDLVAYLRSLKAKPKK